jgi:hypothetical protein
MSKKVSYTFLCLGICLIFLVFVCLSCRDLPGIKQLSEADATVTTKLTEEAIKNSTQLQELDNVCKEIPLPPDFRFIWKGGIDDQKITLSTHYYSETKYEETWALLKRYFAQNGWRIVKDGEGTISSIKIIEFTNGNYRVINQYGGMEKRTNYSICCEKLK